MKSRNISYYSDSIRSEYSEWHPNSRFYKICKVASANRCSNSLNFYSFSENNFFQRHSLILVLLFAGYSPRIDIKLHSHERSCMWAMAHSSATSTSPHECKTIVPGYWISVCGFLLEINSTIMIIFIIFDFLKLKFAQWSKKQNKKQNERKSVFCINFMTDWRCNEKCIH